MPEPTRRCREVADAAPAPPAPFGLQPEHDHPELQHWRAAVGAPVALDLAPPAPAELAGLDVLSWNVAVGAGRLAELLDRLQRERGVGVRPERPLVLLLQEAYRADESVPAAPVGSFHGGLLHRRHRPWSVVELAERRGLSLRYAPSMRNGPEASDRGNAVLASVALGSSHAFSLPYVRQHRVAVSATLAGHPELAFVSAHLDTGGHARAERWRPRLGAGRAYQAAALARRLLHAEGAGAVVLGADLNALLSHHDPALRSLLAAGFEPARPLRPWSHTFHASVRLLLDFVLWHGRARIEALSAERLDERPDDRSRRVFGSDHHPLLAHLRLRHAAAPSPPPPVP